MVYDLNCAVVKSAKLSTAGGVTTVSGDVDGDGFDDVAIQGAGLSVGATYSAVWILGGTRAGLGTLADAGVNVEMISTSEIRITCMISEDSLATALKALHEAFELERPETIFDEPAAAGSPAS